MQKAYLAGGCFWCIEAIFQRVHGVKKVVSGYCNGDIKNPNYEDVCSGNSGHAEAVKIEFDENILTYSQLLDIFFKIHNPTTLNQQGADIGSQYRSAIFYCNDKQQQIASKAIAKIKNAVTELEPIDIFYSAEDYHQNYYNNNKNKPYCKMVILPKIMQHIE